LTPILRLHFSQLHGQENLKPGDIPMAAKIKPLSAKEIKPLLKPEEKSKVEETCETLKAKQQAETSKTLIEALDEAFQPKKTEPEPVKKSIMQRIVHEVKHYANGFKLLFVNIRISVKQFWKILNGQDLSRREKKLVSHGGHKRQQIRPRTNNFLSLVWNITKLSHRIELAIPKNPIVFVFRFCYILAGK
jgi:hypothetical protein